MQNVSYSAISSQSTFESDYVRAFKMACAEATSRNDKTAIATLRAMCGRKASTLTSREQSTLRIWYMRALEAK